MADLTAFIRAETVIGVAPLVPEVRLHLARASREIFQAAERFERPGERWPPYWSFAWPAGQGLARYLLDNPALVRGRRVVDIGAGSGLAAIAALRAGARAARAVDCDDVACAACAMNAGLNGVSLDVAHADPLGEDVDADLVLVGDLVYDPDLGVRVTRFLEQTLARGATILFADRTTARRPPLEMTRVAHYRAPLEPALEDDFVEHANVWLMQPLRGRRHP